MNGMKGSTISARPEEAGDVLGKGATGAHGLQSRHRSGLVGGDDVGGEAGSGGPGGRGGGGGWGGCVGRIRFALELPGLEFLGCSWQGNQG